MSSMLSAGFAKQRDRNEPEIVKALVAVGATVVRMNQIGVPDLLVGFRGATFLFEVKTAVGKLNDNQKRWIAEWQGDVVVVVRTVEEALRALGLEIVTPGLYKSLDDGQPKTYPRPKEK